MKGKRLIAIALTAAITCTTLAACSKEEPAQKPTESIVEVTDADDNIKTNISSDTKSTIELTDLEGNVLTVVPVYNSDGVSIIAGYIELAKDKSGKELDEKAYAYLKQIVGLTFDEENNCSIMYGADKKPITLPALADEQGYIIAIQDTLDIDNDKDKSEYFQAVTKIDSEKNLFIKLDKDDKGNLINVTVKAEENGNKTVTKSDGKSVTAKNTEDSGNLKDLPSKENEGKNDNSQSGGNGNTGNNSNSEGDNGGGNTPAEEETPAIDYTAIVLQRGGNVYCEADNVTVEEATALNGGSEIIVNGAGEHSKYYITSETDAFSGHIDFRFSIGEDVEVKFNDVNITTARKTAIKFTDVDKDNIKESDSEGTGTDLDQSGSSVEAAAPKVELSFTGTNSFKATGSGTNGTIYSECKLEIKGHGTANIDGGQNLSGICSTESIDIRNATLNIVSNAKQGISCDRKVCVETGATINIESKGDGIHCNKFEYLGDSTSSIKIKSLYDTSCADGIDANDYIIINGGKLEVTALTLGKYALKVRKVIKGSSSGQFEINGGTVTSSGSNNTTLTKCLQKTVWLKGSNTQFTVDSYKSASGAGSFICSPCSANTVTNSSSVSKTVTWNGNIGTASFV